MSVIKPPTRATGTGQPAMSGPELRAWREHWMFTQRELARRLRVHLETVGAWERGHSAIPPYLDLALETIARDRAADLAQRAAAGPPTRGSTS